MKKTVGILGGMGPLATADLFSKIIELTPAKSDTEHLHIIIDNNTNISDRTAAIKEKKDTPVAQMQISAKRLEAAGADFIVMPCNTAHFFADFITESVQIPLINMIEQTALEAKKLGYDKVGLLATDGTVGTGLYHKALQAQGIECLVPENASQKEVMNIIYNGIKAGNTSLSPEGFKAAIEELLAKGACCVLLACTELPVAFKLYNLDYPHIDPTTVLAKAAVREGGFSIE